MRHLTMLPMLLMSAAGDPDGGGATPAADPPSSGEPGPVPYDRFQQVTTERAQFKDRAETLEAENVRLREQVGQVEQVQSAFDQFKQQAADDLVLAELGMDRAGRKVARALFEDVPEADRPEGGLSAWIKQHRESPDAAPRPLQAYFQTPSPSTPAPSPATGTPPSSRTPSPAPSPSQGQTGSPPSTTGTEITAEALREARELGRRTGDYSRFRELRDQVQKRAS